MDPLIYEQAQQIYALYRNSVPLKDPDIAKEQELINTIYSALITERITVSDQKLRKIISDYIAIRKKTEAEIEGHTNDPVYKEATRISTFFKAQSSNMWTSFWGGLTNFFKNETKDIFNSLIGADAKSYEALVNWLISSGFVSKDSAAYLQSMFNSASGLSGVPIVMIFFGVITTWLFQAMPMLMGDYRKKLNAGFTPEITSIPDLIRALHIAPELATTIDQKLKQNGLDDEDIKLTKIASYALYDVGTIETCFLRKIISKEEAVSRLSELSFTPERIKEIMSTWEIIPSPQDLLWMVGKEAFEPDQIQQFGLDAEFPTEQVEWLTKQGYSEYWARKYWAAHWDYPSEGRVLDLYHRGLIGDGELDAFYRVIEMPVYWREKLKKASYNLYTRIDLRRMHDTGIVTEKEVYDNFKGEGYDHEHATKLTQFFVKYNELNDKDLSLSQIRNAYESDMITKSKAMDMLRGLNYTQDQIDLILLSIEHDELVKKQKIRIKAIARMYKNKTYSKGDVRVKLSSLGVEPTWIETYLDQWDDEAILEEEIPQIQELIKWYMTKTISTDVFVSYLRKLRYSEATIAIYVKSNAPPI